MKKNYTSQKGYVIYTVTFFILIIMLSMALSIGFLIANMQKNITNSVKSSQSYYAAESGAEDALLRLEKKWQSPGFGTYYLNVNNATATVNIPGVIGGSTNITSQGNNGGIIKNIQVAYSIDVTGVSFFYGAQVGPGGLSMDNNTTVNGDNNTNGNIFSDGPISGSSSGVITGNAVVSGTGSITGVTVNGNALAYSCLSPALIKGNLTWVTGGAHTCTVNGTTNSQASQVSPEDLPITQTDIDDWKSDAVNECDSALVAQITGNNNNNTISMGPCKISHPITFGNHDNLIMTGTIYVTGDVTFGNTDTIKLDNSYGALGGVFLADGQINTGTSNVFSGSGQAGSYLLVVSTSTSDTAIDVFNNTNGAVFYACHVNSSGQPDGGGITIENGVSLIQITGYKLTMKQNSSITYSSGLANLNFTSGPSGGGWKVTSWQEQ